MPSSYPRALDAANKKVNVELQGEFLTMLRGSSLSDIETFLVEQSENIDVNQFSKDGQTPIHKACQQGNLPLVKLLVQYGANVKLTNRSGFSLLHLAAFCGNPSLLSYVTKLR